MMMPRPSAKTAATGSAVVMLLLGLLCAGASDPMRAEITELTEIPVKSGLNYLDNFAADGRQGLIIVGWRDNGNAWGYHVYMVMLSSAAETGAWEVVTTGMKRNAGDAVHQLDVIRDTPHTVEDAITSVRFGRGRVAGRPATLLIIARRDISKAPSAGAATPVAFDVFRLMRNEDDIGKPQHYFARIDTLHATKRYCNSDLALNKELRLPLPRPYIGPNLDDGCPR
jgi:hypothetical protein